MSKTRFGMIGCGWRAEFFMRVAQELPDLFEVSRVLIRDPGKDKAKSFLSRWDVPTCGDLNELLQTRDMAFVLSTAQARSNPELLPVLAEHEMPTLCETPAGRNIDDMKSLYELVERGARIQVAEQLHMQPYHASRIALAHSGLLGKVSHANVSVCHGYHGISLIRRMLGVTFENATITAKRFAAPIVTSPGRDGPPDEESISDVNQEVAWLDFGDRLGINDFTAQHYFSMIRSHRTLIRGERGEINNEHVRYLTDFRNYVHTRLQRENAGEDGDLDGHYLKGILTGSEWVYRNEFIPARLTDDEIAVATALKRMAEYVDGGPEFYSFAEGCQDRYLDLMISEAISTGQPVQTQTQPWAS